FGLALVIGAASAQAPKPTIDDVHQRDQELDAIRAEQKKAVEAQKQLRDEIAALAEDRRKLNQALIDTAAGIRADEDKIAAAETRLAQLTGNEAVIRKSLDGRGAIIIAGLGGLER